MEYIADSLGVIVCATALFAAIIVCLAVPPKMTKKLISTIAVITAVGALLLYGYGYAVTEPAPVVAVFKATFASCRIFVGSNSWGEVEMAYNKSVFMQVVFWLLHLMGLFTSASAAVTALGSGLMRKLRMWAFRKRDITIIYGMNANTIYFGQQLVKEENASIVYVDPNAENRLSAAVDQMGAILRSDPDAVQASQRFFRSVGLRAGKRKVWLYALHTSVSSDQQYARDALASLQALGVTPEQTALTILGPGDETDNHMLAQNGRYGYGNLISLNEPEMIARMLMQTYPPNAVIDFDRNGKAVNDFHGLIIGFGQVGQAVLRHMVMNGQFYGSDFCAAVFAPDFEQTMGCLSQECSSMLEHYDIRFHGYDGRSRQLFAYLAEHADTINYIAICTGKSVLNTEIADGIRNYLHRCGRDLPIYMANRSGICQQTADDRLTLHKIYTPYVLCSDKIDRMAMVLNHFYTKSGNMRDNWRNCGYFNRMSSRAAADAYDTTLRAAGVTAEQAMQSWNPQGELLENLSHMEHLRWNAFHYCMGFRPMTDAEFEARVQEYREAKKKDPNTRYRITRDMDRRIHACLIDWDELDAYSVRENAITGGHRDYKDDDSTNIRAVADILRAGNAR